MFFPKSEDSDEVDISDVLFTFILFSKSIFKGPHEIIKRLKTPDIIEFLNTKIITPH